MAASARSLTWTEARAWLHCDGCGRPARQARPHLEAWPWAGPIARTVARLVNRLTGWRCLECACRIPTHDVQILTRLHEDTETRD